MFLRKIKFSPENQFDVTSMGNCQMTSGPIELLTLVILLIVIPNIENNDFNINNNHFS